MNIKIRRVVFDCVVINNSISDSNVPHSKEHLVEVLVYLYKEIPDGYLTGDLPTSTTIILKKEDVPLMKTIDLNDLFQVSGYIHIEFSDQKAADYKAYVYADKLERFKDNSLIKELENVE